jgi:predicted NBD/HSP70 family sugar kinase
MSFFWMMNKRDKKICYLNEPYLKDMVNEETGFLAALSRPKRRVLSWDCYNTIMIVAIDIGGTKTLIATADKNGNIISKFKFPSPINYEEYVQVLVKNVNDIAKNQPIDRISIGSAGTIDRNNGVIVNSPNLKWLNKPLVSDLSKSLDCQNIVIENDANLAGLSEAHSLDNVNQKVMYVTFSTGIGTGFVENGVLDPELLDSEGGHMVFEHEGKMMDWESFAAGRAIVEKYGKRAAELDDEAAWRDISKNMAIGIVNNCAVFMPDTVIIGGGVGTYFDKYSKFLREEIDILIPISEMIPKPKVVGAKYAEEAVILGCILLAKQHEQRS